MMQINADYVQRMCESSIEGITEIVLDIPAYQSDFVVVCAQTSVLWDSLLRRFVPEYNWDILIKSGELTTVCSVVEVLICDVIAHMCDELRESLMREVPAGYVKVIALAGLCCNVYHLEIKKSTFTV